MKKTSFIILGLALIIIGSIGAVSAAPSKPVYATLQQVEQMISNAISPLQTAIDSLGNRLSLVETAITGNASDIQTLNNRVTSLESGSQAIDLPFEVSIRLENVVYWPNDKVINAEFKTYSSYPYYHGLFNTWVSDNIIAGELPRYVIVHLPDGDRGFNSVSGDITIPLETVYPSGTVIPLDVHTYYFGKELTTRSSVTIP